MRLSPVIILWCSDRRSHLVTADLGLKFRVAGESSGLKLKGFVVLEDGSLAFSKGFSRVIDQRCLVMSKLPLVKMGKLLQGQ